MSEYQPLPEIIIPHHISQIRKESLLELDRKVNTRLFDGVTMLVPERSAPLAIAGFEKRLEASGLKLLRVTGIGNETTRRFTEETNYDDVNFGLDADEEDLQALHLWIKQDHELQQTVTNIRQHSTERVALLDDTFSERTTELGVTPGIVNAAGLEYQRELNYFIFPSKQSNWIMSTMARTFPDAKNDLTTLEVLTNLAKGSLDHKPAQLFSIRDISMARIPQNVQEYVEYAMFQSLGYGIRPNYSQIADFINKYGPNLDSLHQNFIDALTSDIA